jgi:DNA-binding transcriptional LysR family regulator
MATAFDPATLDWNLLRALGAVLAQGSLTQAAARLGTSQPTLSRQIASLEAAVGAPLFERGARRLIPTATALALAEPAARMLAAAQACALAADVASAEAGALAGTVRLTASEVVSCQVLPDLLADLARRHPEIQIELVPGDSLSNLLEREADIAVRMLRPTQGTLITRHIADWPLGFFARRELLAAHGGAPTPATLADHRWVGFDQSTQLIDGFRGAGFEVDRRFFAFRSDHQVLNLAAVRAGLGIGIVMVPLARRLPELVPVLQALKLPVLPVWLTAHRELRASRRLRLVWDHLADGLRRWGQGPQNAASPGAAARGVNQADPA